MTPEIEKSMDLLRQTWGKAPSTCATCASWKHNEKMTPLGLANCAHLPQWTFNPSNGHCPKWTEKKEQTHEH